MVAHKRVPWNETKISLGVNSKIPIPINKDLSKVENLLLVITVGIPIAKRWNYKVNGVYKLIKVDGAVTSNKMETNSLAKEFSNNKESG